MISDGSQTNPKYMIDYSTYRQMHPTKFPPLASEIEMEEQGIYFHEDDLPDVPNFAVLLPGAMLGYAFHDKKWSEFCLQFESVLAKPLQEVFQWTM
jgi:hypothetical protein